MGADESDIDQGGSGCPDIGTDLIGGGSIGTAIRVRYMVPDSNYEEGVGRIPPQGVPQDDRAATTEGAERRLGLPPDGGCNGGGRLPGGGDLRLLPPEQSSTIYCY